jgi:hypothetical protein
MAGYTRNDTANNIATGNVINASDLDGEFDALVAAFNASTGHVHDGTSANGAPITKVGPAQDLVVSGTTVLPKTTNTLDLGSSTYKFKDAYIDGIAYMDQANITASGAATTYSAKQTFNGATSELAAAFKNAVEPATVSATAATGTINFDITTQSLLYYTSNASANWTVNLRGNSSTSLNTLMSTGDVVTVTFLVTQGSTAYYNSAVQVDGSSVTPKWQGGTAPSAGNASSIDAYTYAIVKTASATFTVFASQTKYA